MSKCSYLSSEPLLVEPIWNRQGSAQGAQGPPFAYAGNNPVRNCDADGLRLSLAADNPGFSREENGALADLLDRARRDPCSRDLLHALDALPQNIVLGLARGGEGKRTLLGYVAGNPRNSNLVRAYINPDHIGPDPLIRGFDIGNLVHELWHAYLNTRPIWERQRLHLDSERVQHQLIEKWDKEYRDCRRSCGSEEAGP